MAKDDKPTMTPEQEAYGVANGLAATAAICKRLVGFAHVTYTMVVLVAAQLTKLGMEVTEPWQPRGSGDSWRIDAVWPRPGASISVDTGSCWTGDSICMTLATRARTSRRSVAWLTADERTAQMVVKDLCALGMSAWGPKRKEASQPWEVVAEWPGLNADPKPPDVWEQATGVADRMAHNAVTLNTWSSYTTHDHTLALWVAKDLHGRGFDVQGPTRPGGYQARGVQPGGSSWVVMAATKGCPQAMPTDTRVAADAPPNTRELALDEAAQHTQDVLDKILDRGPDCVVNDGLFNSICTLYDHLGDAMDMRAQALPKPEPAEVSDHLWSALDEVAELIPRLVSCLGFLPEQAHQDRDKLICDASRVLGQLALSRHLDSTTKAKKQADLEDAVHLILVLDEYREDGQEVVALCLESRDQLRKAVSLEPIKLGLGDHTPQYELRLAIRAMEDVAHWMEHRDSRGHPTLQTITQAVKGLKGLAGVK